MEYTHYIVEDFVLDESFKNWVLKKDQKDEAFWEQWVQEHPEVRSKVDEARDIILSMQVDEAKVSNKEIEDQFREVERFFDKQMAPDKKVISLRRVTRVAASALILLSLGAGAWYYVQQTESGSDGITGENEKIVSVPRDDQQEKQAEKDKKTRNKTEAKETTPQQPEIETGLAEHPKADVRIKRSKPSAGTPVEEKVTRYVTGDNEKKRIILPDGSKVYLNEKSRLAYRGSFRKEETRQVELTGEAYFQVEEKVHQGKKIGFVVSTRDMEVEVVGTEFNVQSRIEQTRVFLNSGKVQLKINGQSEALAMKPGEMVEYNAHSGAVRSSKPDQLRFISWLEAFGKSVRSTPHSGRMTMQTQSKGSDNNQAEIWQSGEDNHAYIDQVGENLKSKQLQQGKDNEARAVVNGQSRRDQSDEAGWSTWQLQQGEGNVSIFNIVQSYNSNLYSAQAGRRNMARGRSKGEDNAGVILQSGEYNEAQLLQRGKDNEALILQKGQGGVSPESSGFMEELMEGRYNKVNVIQKGYNNSARTVQQGRNNRVEVNQNGN